MDKVDFSRLVPGDTLQVVTESGTKYLLHADEVPEHVTLFSFNKATPEAPKERYKGIRMTRISEVPISGDSEQMIIADEPVLVSDVEVGRPIEVRPENRVGIDSDFQSGNGGFITSQVIRIEPVE
jgi:hypothetical protein